MHIKCVFLLSYGMAVDVLNFATFIFIVIYKLPHKVLTYRNYFIAGTFPAYIYLLSCFYRSYHSAQLVNLLSVYICHFTYSRREIPRRKCLDPESIPVILQLKHTLSS